MKIAIMLLWTGAQIPFTSILPFNEEKRSKEWGRIVFALISTSCPHLTSFGIKYRLIHSVIHDTENEKEKKKKKYLLLPKPCCQEGRRGRIGSWLDVVFSFMG